MTVCRFNIKQQKGSFKFHLQGEIDKGITGVFGPSGSGKTTLLHTLSGIEKPLSGNIMVYDEVIFDREANIDVPVQMRKTGYVFQDARLFPHLTVRQNLVFGYKYLDKKPEDGLLKKISSLLEIDGLLNHKPWQLSGGQQQRVAIGRALLTQPRLLLMDEPFSNLDKNLRKQIISYLLRINNHLEIPVLVVSHDLEDLLRLTQNILVVSAGSVIAHDNYFGLCGNKKVSDILGSNDLLSVIDARVVRFNDEKKLLYLETLNDIGNLIVLQTGKVNEDLKMGNRVRVGIKPEDIAISSNKVTGISIQNQWEGEVKELYENEDGVLCLIDCGFELLAELTHASVNNLEIKPGSKIFCMVKSKGIEMIHIYSK